MGYKSACGFDSQMPGMLHMGLRSQISVLHLRESQCLVLFLCLNLITRRMMASKQNVAPVEKSKFARMKLYVVTKETWRK